MHRCTDSSQRELLFLSPLYRLAAEVREVQEVTQNHTVRWGRTPILSSGSRPYIPTSPLHWMAQLGGPGPESHPSAKWAQSERISLQS